MSVLCDRIEIDDRISLPHAIFVMNTRKAINHWEILIVVAEFSHFKLKIIFFYWSSSGHQLTAVANVCRNYPCYSSNIWKNALSSKAAF